MILLAIFLWIVLYGFILMAGVELVYRLLNKLSQIKDLIFDED